MQCHPELVSESTANNRFLVKAGEYLAGTLQPVLSRATALRQSLRGDDTNAAMDIFEDALMRLRHLTDDIHTYTELSLDHPTPELRFVDMALAFDRASKRSTSLHPDKQVKITQEIAVSPLIVDDTALQMVLDQLVDNAYKSSPEHETVLLRAVSDGATTAVIEIVDNGVSVADEQLAVIFEPFAKPYDVLHQDSTNLGMSICKKLSIDGAESSRYLPRRRAERLCVLRFRTPWSRRQMTCQPRRPRLEALCICYSGCMTTRATLLWMDLEMTGLDPGEDRILEVAVIATDWDLKEIATYEAVVKVGPNLMKRRMVGEFWDKYSAVRDALVAQNESGRSARTVENELLEFVDEHFSTDKPVILAGNSIHQDRKFLDNEWPRLSDKLHYRMLDVTAWKVVMEGKYKKKFAKPEQHRALEDIRGSIEELTYYLGKVKV